MISGLTLIRNATHCGYPIELVIDCLDVISDEIIVMEGHSTDNTLELLHKINNPKLKIIKSHWDLKSTDGLEFKTITDNGLKHCSGNFIFYLQGDEVMHHKDIKMIPDILGSDDCVRFPIVHLRGLDKAWDEKFTKYYYHRAIRFFRNGKGFEALYDAFSFESPTTAKTWESNLPIFHAGYIDAKSVCLKLINHAKNFYVPTTKIGKNVLFRAHVAYEIFLSLEDGKIDDAMAWRVILDNKLTTCHSSELSRHNYSLPPGLHTRFPHGKQ